MEITIYAGDKTIINDGSNTAPYCTSFECDKDDIDTAYSALSENLFILSTKELDPSEDNADIIDFQNLKDDSIEILLEDAKEHGFISDYEIKE